MLRKRYIADHLLSCLGNADVLRAAMLLREQLGTLVPEDNEVVDIEPILKHYVIGEVHNQLMGSLGMLVGAPSGWHAVARRDSDCYTRRYTLAHELGHWLLYHRFGIDAQVAEELGLYREIEELCDVFASLTLVTPKSIERRFSGRNILTFATLETCARELKVPIRAVLHRLAISHAIGEPDQCVLTFHPDPISNRLTAAVSSTLLPDGICLPRECTADKLVLRHLVEKWAEFVPGRDCTFCEEVILREHSVKESCGSPIAFTASATYRVFRSPDGIFIVGLFVALQRKATAQGRDSSNEGMPRG